MEEYCYLAGDPLHAEWRAIKNERSHVTKANTIIGTRGGLYFAPLRRCAVAPMAFGAAPVLFGALAQASKCAAPMRWGGYNFTVGASFIRSSPSE